MKVILWLFTIEPSFFADLNEACISMDSELMEMLGPFARAIHLILKYVELNRENKMPFGMEFDLSGDPLGAFSQCFLLFRGTQMTKSAVETWRDQVARESFNQQGQPVARCLQLKGSTSTSESFRIAMNFVQGKSEQTWLQNKYFNDPDDEEIVPVLFLISVQNYNGFNGFRLNGEKYSAYPLEREVILLDGTKVIVMKVEEVDVKHVNMDLNGLDG